MTAATEKSKHGSVPVATMGTLDTTICINNRESPVFLLNDGQRVLTQDGMAYILGWKKGSDMRRSLESSRLKPFYLTALGANGLSDAHPLDAHLNNKRSLKALGDNAHSSAHLNNKHNPASLGANGLSDAHPLSFKMPQSGKLAKGYPSSFVRVVFQTYANAASAKDSQGKAILDATQLDHATYLMAVMSQLSTVTIDALIDRALGIDSDTIMSRLEREIAEWRSLQPTTRRVEYSREFCELIVRLYGRDPRKMTHKQIMGYSGTVADRDILCRLPGRIHRALNEINEWREEHGRRQHVGTAFLRRHDDETIEKGYNWFCRVRDRYEREMRASLDMGWSMEQHRARWDAVGEPFPADSLWHDRHERRQIQEKANQCRFQLLLFPEPIEDEEIEAA